MPANNNIIGPIRFNPDANTQEDIELVEKEFSDYFGSSNDFWFAVTASQAQKSLEHFIFHNLPYFGQYQDAMQSNEGFLFHSVISIYINCGLLDPLKTCQRVEQAYYDGAAPINAVEGFIRQVIGWREFVRGVYWRYMPEYKNLNYLNAEVKMPEFYWDGDCNMNCISEVIKITKNEAYSHHIQRLMVTGNFALLAGLNPQQISDWYLMVYADAYEWVHLPNTIGMALHADGGVVGTKPYIASGAYINRMSNFCKSCHYDVKQRIGKKACPFNFLYWDFLIRHEDKFRNNHRMRIAYKNLDEIQAKEREVITNQAIEFIKQMS